MSAFGNTQTKLRNRLTTENVEKLVSIRWNLGLFNEESSISMECECSSSSSVASINSDTDSD